MTNLSILASLCVAALPLLAGYALAAIHKHVKNLAASNALQAIVSLAETAARAALSGGNVRAAGEDALAATVVALRGLASSEIAYLEGLHGVPSVRALLQALAAHALASVSGQVSK